MGNFGEAKPWRCYHKSIYRNDAAVTIIITEALQCASLDSSEFEGSWAKNSFLHPTHNHKPYTQTHTHTNSSIKTAAKASGGVKKGHIQPLL